MRRFVITPETRLVEADGKTTRDGFLILKQLFDALITDTITVGERSSNPSDPDEGNFVLWMSDGTGAGDDGDIMIKITAGGTTKTATLVDFSTL